MASRNHYYLSIADLAHARGSVSELSYTGAGPNDFASALQDALHSSALFDRWRAMQPDPDDIDPNLGATDATALAALAGAVATGAGAELSDSPECCEQAARAIEVAITSKRRRNIGNPRVVHPLCG